MIKKLYNKMRYNLFSPMPPTRKSEKKIKDFIRKIRYNLFGHIPILGRRPNFGESHKSKPRRQREGFFDKYCQGHGLDIGYGGDPVVTNVVGWDFEHGDAHYLKGLEDAQFDFVYSSHLLEHLPDIETAIVHWWRVLKTDGYLILYLPHRDLYEKKKTLPSRFNDDHAHFFLPEKDELPDTIGLLPFINRMLPGAKIEYCKVCDEGYHSVSDEIQSDGEYSIELIARKI